MLRRVLGFALLSAGVLVPCLWLPRIYTVDLPSHAYNAWLAMLAEKGQAPGIYLAPISYNFAFDWLLTEAMRFSDPDLAQLLSVSLCVLVFFWGALAWLHSWGRRDTLLALPPLILATYGWVFHAGFYNFYLGFGLGLFGCALASRRILLSAPFNAAALICHPIAGACTLALMLAQFALDRLPEQRRLWGVGVAAILIHAAGFAGRTLLATVPRDGFFSLFGADQLSHTSYASRVVEIAFIALGLALIGSLASNAPLTRLVHNRPFQLLALANLAVWALPWGIKLARYEIPITLIRDRASLVVLLCFTLFWLSVDPPKWARMLMLALCALSLVLMFAEARRAHLVEERIRAVVQPLPQGTRIFVRVTDLGSRTPLLLHIAERACIGHCFVISNYEPSTGHFRLRAEAESRIALADSQHIGEMNEHGYRLRPEDLPLVLLHSDPRDCSHIVATGAREGMEIPELVGVSWSARALFPVLPKAFKQWFVSASPCTL